MKQRTFKLKEFAQDISVAVKDAQLSPLKRFVGLEHYDSNEPVITRFTDTSLLSSSVKEFSENDILIARRNVYLRRAGIVFFSGLTSGDSIVLRIYNDCEERTGIPKDDAIRIIPFILNSNDFWAYANKHADGMNSKRISKDMLYDYEFSLPSIEEQRILADKLWAAYRLKESYKKLLIATQEMVKSQFIEMFEGNKYPRLSLDNIAKEWLKGQGFKKDDICEDGNTKCIHYGELFTKYGPVITEVASRTYVEKKKISKIGDILFPASDVTPNGLARCSMLPFNDVILGGDIIVLRPKDEYSPAYLSYAINQQTSQLLTRVNGGVVKHMSAKGLKTVEIPIPPKDKQEEYIQFAHQADKSEFELRKSIEAIDQVIKSLINDIK